MDYLSEDRREGHAVNMASGNMASGILFSGGSNRGTQVGINSGYIVNNYGQLVPPKPKPSSTVPFRRDPDFVDRDIILAQVDEICSEPAARAALVGLGGVGKSQLAIEYSHRIHERDPQTWVFWVHASSSARFEEGYRKIADRIKLPRIRNESTADILRLVSDWLSDEANGRWIMILDNADDSTIFSNQCKRGDVGATVSLSTFLPQSRNGSILVTSRSRETALKLTGRHRDIIKVEPMDEDRALLLFKKKLPDQFDQDNAKELLRVLDYMPLAISQAAAYISEGPPRVSVAEYLDTFRASDKQQAMLLDADADDISRDPAASNSIITTWQISFEHIHEKKPSAARLLSLMSFFDRQGIPEFLLRHYDDRQDSSNLQFQNNADEDSKRTCDLTFEDDVGTLTSYSLIRASVENDSFEMHRIVQFSVRKWLQLNGEQEKWKKIYIGIIREALPRDQGYKNWQLSRVLYPHAEAVLAYRPTEQKDLLDWSDVLNVAGCFASAEGNYFKAAEMIGQALKGWTKALENEHLRTPNSIFYTMGIISNLASVLCDLEKFEESEDLSRQVLDMNKKYLGKEHPDTLMNIHNLAMVLWYQGKFEAAEEMNRQVLDGMERVCGKEDPGTLLSMSNLASMLEKQGKFEAAEKMNRQALDGRIRILGEGDPRTLLSMSNLASVLQKQRKFEEAETMFQQALDERIRILGKEHPDTLENIDALASVLEDQGKFEAAEQLFRQALDVREKALGMGDPDTLETIKNLRSVLFKQWKVEAVVELFQRAFDGLEKVEWVAPHLDFSHNLRAFCMMGSDSESQEKPRHG